MEEAEAQQAKGGAAVAEPVHPATLGFAATKQISVSFPYSLSLQLKEPQNTYFPYPLARFQTNPIFLFLEHILNLP